MEDFRGEQRRSVVTKLIANEMGGGGHKNVTELMGDQYMSSWHRMFRVRFHPFHPV